MGFGVKSVTKAFSKAGSGLVSAATKTAKTATKAATQTATKATTTAVNQTGKAIEKAAETTGKAVAKGTETAVNKAIEVGKNLADSSVKTVSSLAKGDLLGAAQNAINATSYGTIDATGKNKGILNVNTTKYIAKLFGGTPETSTSAEINSAGMVQTSTNKRSGLLKQLRQARGSAVGGSYSTVAKNPLGGSSGKTGK